MLLLCELHFHKHWNSLFRWQFIDSTRAIRFKRCHVTGCTFWCNLFYQFRYGTLLGGSEKLFCLHTKSSSFHSYFLVIKVAFHFVWKNSFFCNLPPRKTIKVKNCLLIFKSIEGATTKLSDHTKYCHIHQLFIENILSFYFRWYKHPHQVEST